MRNNPIYETSPQNVGIGLDYDRVTITLRGRELTVSEALNEGLLAPDEHTGLMRLGGGYTPRHADHH
ncbi:MAG: hypothetical protein K9H25_22375 [Rhodospirillum sp.]|nr:hypothetical protein [Rhodospirillum sp.]MCF8491885.1 hypothetical protein [Rhodospirillum sp.]MCF8502267.1 hypothetical protein [Rhodospirillum sp.]